MSGLVTRRHAFTCCLIIIRYYGWRKWFRLVFSRRPVALTTLY